MPKSLYMKGMIIPLKMKSTILTLLEAKVITIVKTNNTKLFATLKARR